MSEWRTPSSHPSSCRVCEGTGWQLGPDIHSVADGHVVTYSTVEPCTNHWANDDPFVDRDGLDRVHPMPFPDYHRRLIARHRRGDPNAPEEIAGWKRAETLFRDDP